MNRKQIIPFTCETFVLSLLFVSAFNFVLRGQSEDLRQISELFALCGEGVSFSALGELLLLSVLIAAVRYLLFSEKILKNMLTQTRITLMLMSVFFLAGICSAVFHWFPFHMWQAWLGFFLSFSVGTAVSFTVMNIKTGMESKQYQDKLDMFRQGNHEDEDSVKGA